MSRLHANVQNQVRYRERLPNPCRVSTVHIQDRRKHVTADRVARSTVSPGDSLVIHGTVIEKCRISAVSSHAATAFIYGTEDVRARDRRTQGWRTGYNRQSTKHVLLKRETRDQQGA